MKVFLGDKQRYRLWIKHFLHYILLYTSTFLRIYIFFSIEMRPSIRYANALNNFYQIEKLSAQVELIFFINLKIFQHIYSIYNRHQFFCLSDFQSNPIILCVYYYYTLITFNYKEEVITFTDWHLKRKGFWDWNPYEYKCKWLWHMYNGALI